VPPAKLEEKIRAIVRQELQKAMEGIGATAQASPATPT
jgi:hypothetical protein